jgi:hypothetical protein
MNVSTNSKTQSLSTAPGDIQKTAQTIQERQNIKILEEAAKLTNQINAQKTGVGNTINING